MGNLRRHRKIPGFQPPTTASEGPVLTIREAAQILDAAPSTLHRWLSDGFIVGEQDTPGAPWRIRLTAELKALFVAQAPPGYLPMLETTKRLGVCARRYCSLSNAARRTPCMSGTASAKIRTDPDLFDPAP